MILAQVTFPLWFGTSELLWKMVGVSVFGVIVCWECVVVFVRSLSCVCCEGWVSVSREIGSSFEL